MLHKQRSKKTAVLKYGLFLPLFAVALVMSSATIRKNEKILAIAEKLPLSEPLSIIQDAISGTGRETLTAVSTPHSKSVVILNGNLPTQDLGQKSAPGWSGLMDHLKRSIKYPAAATANQTQGYTLTQFGVLNGELQGVSVGGPSLGGGTDAEVMSRVLSYPDFKTIPDGKYVIKTSFLLNGVTGQQKNKDIKQPEGYTYVGEIVIRSYSPKTTTAKNDPNDIRVYDFVSLEFQPTFPGGMNNFYAYLKENVRYPSEAKASKLEGKVFLSFVVEKDGSLMDIKVDRKLGGGTDEEAVRVLEASPKWQPGIQNGNVVRVKYNIPISFSLASSTPNSGTTGEKSSSSVQQVYDFVASPIQEDKVHDFTSLDQQPTFPGGMAQFYQYLKRTVVYPMEAQEKNIQGKVFLSFTVEKNGELTNIKVDRKLGGGTDEEAIRVIKLSPHWIPGLLDKKPVRVKYNIPISFTLSK
ncbi:MAG: energy transducer TonB [Pedobacter sp.]|nr:energy transducer TonB [Pedobacter sp.]